MMNNWHILTECYVDTLLVQTLSPAKQYNHQYSCNNVLKTMSEKFSNSAALGIIDNDKVKQDLLNSFKSSKTVELLSIYQIDKKPHFIITLGSKNKAVEDFILKNAEKCDIHLSEYGLPTDLNELKNITKHIYSLKDAELNLKRLFTAIKQSENADFSILANWINTFKTDPYNINVENL